MPSGMCLARSNRSRKRSTSGPRHTPAMCEAGVSVGDCSRIRTELPSRCSTIPCMRDEREPPTCERKLVGFRPQFFLLQNCNSLPLHFLFFPVENFYFYSRGDSSGYAYNDYIFGNRSGRHIRQMKGGKIV